MDNPVIAFPRDLDGAAESEAAIAEIDAAIAMVTGGHAIRVRLTAVPDIAQVAGVGAAHANAVGVGFRLESPQRAGVITVTVGPLA